MNPAPSRPVRGRLRHLPVVLAACGVLAVAAAVLGGSLRGWGGAWGAVVGVAVVAASYTASTVAIAWADSVSPQLVLPVGMVTYVVKFTLLCVGAVALGNTGWAGLAPMAGGIAAGVVVWSAAQIWSTLSGRAAPAEPD